MAKIRGVKPDYWTDEDIVELTLPARLLLIGLWNYACDNGHLQDKPKQIKMRIMPGDDVSATELLAELEQKRRIVRAGGWITIPNLTHHQKPDRRYFTTCDKRGCEDPPEKVSQRESRRVHAVHTPSAQGVHDVGTECALVDGDGEGEVMVRGTAAGKPRRATSLPNDFAPNDTNARIAGEHGVNLARVVPQFIDWHQAKGTTYKDWHAALNTWIRREKPDTTTGPKRPAYRPPNARDVEQPPDGLTPEQYTAWELEQRNKRAES